MPTQLISIQEAADLSKKSIQTIRRAIKSKKLQFKRKRTPQGFNYLIELDSVYRVYNIPKTSGEKAKDEYSVKVPKKAKTSTKEISSNKDDYSALVKALESMVHQHSEERQNFLRLMNTLQEKIFVLENQINLLKAPKKHWYQVWK